MDPQPPRLAQRLLQFVIRKELANEVLGDLDEQFYQVLRRRSPLRAKLDYWMQVANYLRPFAIRKLNHANPLQSYMITNYFAVARRNFVRHRLYSTIKVGSLAVGVAACLAIALYLRDELSRDRQFADANQIYRVVGAVNEDGEINRNVFMPAPAATAMTNDFPEIITAGRFNSSELFGAGTGEVRPADRLENGFDDGIAYVDPVLLHMLRLTFVQGNPDRALEEPRTVVLSRSKAEKYFPGGNALGKLIILNNDEKNPFTIDGVVEDFRNASQFPFEIMITTAGMEFWKGEQNDWGASNYPTYIKVESGTDIHALEKKITKGMLEKYIVPMLVRDGISQIDAQKMVANAWIELQPLTDVHLHSYNIRDGLQHGDIRIVWLFTSIAVFILLIAAVNFINLSTARSANRAKEVGMRKVSGSMRHQLILQFMTESVMYSLCAFVVGIALAAILMPYFNAIAGKDLSFPWLEWQAYAVFVVAAVLIGMLAGLYPAVYLSSFKPILVLKGKLTQGSRGSVLRSGLVVFQFAISVILLVGTITIYKQVVYILNKDLGFNKDQVVLIEGGGALGQQATPFREEVRQLSAVQQATLSEYLPVSSMKRNGNSFWHEGKVQTEKPVIAEIWKVDPFYLETLGISIREGRNFRADLASDSSGVIINEAMAHELGGGELLGQHLSNGRHIFTIVGVVKDFHFSSFRERIGPLCLALGNSPTILAVRMKSNDVKQSLSDLETVWHKFLPQQPFRYSFLDDRFAAMYDDVQRVSRIVGVFSGLAILVACLGLFGLSSFMIEQRIKEISIRLIHGASTASVFSLLTGNFMKLVLIAIVVAVPVSSYLMELWLRNFVYRVSLDWMTFAAAGVASALIALGTVSRQAWRAGNISPAQTLRSS